jgi:hypothetical protein
MDGWVCVCVCGARANLDFVFISLRFLQREAFVVERIDTVHRDKVEKSSGSRPIVGARCGGEERRTNKQTRKRMMHTIFFVVHQVRSTFTVSFCTIGFLRSCASHVRSGWSEKRHSGRRSENKKKMNPTNFQSIHPVLQPLKKKAIIHTHRKCTDGREGGDGILLKKKLFLTRLNQFSFFPVDFQVG